MGNGILTFIDERVKYSDFFNENEMLFYKNENDLCDKILNLKDDIDKINKISKNGKRKYFEIFNNLIISDFITNKTLGTNSKQKYVWDK